MDRAEMVHLLRRECEMGVWVGRVRWVIWWMGDNGSIGWDGPSEERGGWGSLSEAKFKMFG